MKRFVLLAMVIVIVSVNTGYCFHIPERNTKFNGEIMEIPRSATINL